MRKVVKNAIHLEGYVYEHNLAVKTVQNKDSENFGKEFINGTLDIATDDDCLNVVTVNFTYVTPTTKAGKTNETYTVLKEIIDSGKTVLVDGKDAAMKVRIDTALGLNDFYTNRNGEETLVSAKKCESGFVHKTNTFGAERNKFEFDMVINGTRLVEADEERHIDEDYLIIRGCVFNFRKDMLPVELVVKSKGGMQYFQSLDASNKNLVFTKVWGSIKSENIVTRVEEESAFGDPQVKEYTRSRKEWIVEGAAREPYEIGDAENGITMEELKEADEKRNTYLADVKKRQDEYQASKNAGTGAAGVSTASTAGFNF